MEHMNNGYLIIIGGAEDKEGDCVILREAAAMLEGNDLLTILTTASEIPLEIGEEYKRVFQKLGMNNIRVLDIKTRDVANSPEMCKLIKNSKCVFMTGGDQLRITSILGGTEAYKAIKEVYFSGGLVMGTSAGAAVMSDTMVVRGSDNEPAKKCTLKMAPGLDLINDVIIDQHFDQRGRFGRLLCGVAENPAVLGIGIDEDTAIKVYPDLSFEVIGSNVVTIIDCSNIQSSNVPEQKQNGILAVVGIAVHALPQGYGFNLKNREVKKL